MLPIKKALLLVIVPLFFVFTYIHFTRGTYLTFSDGAKFADVARNVVSGSGYVSSFSFFGDRVFRVPQTSFYSASAIPLGMPYSISVFFLLFGISDVSVVYTSVFYFLALSAGVFFLGKKLYSEHVGFLALLAVSANLSFLDYATSGASEVMFAAIAVWAAYFAFSKSLKSKILFFVLLGLLYLTRPQGIVFVFFLFFTWLYNKYSLKKSLLIVGVFLSVVLIVDKFVLLPLSFRYPVYPIVIRGVQAVFQYSPSESVSNALRGELPNVVNNIQIVKKLFYNIYNFYKLIPQIFSPYLIALTAISFVMWDSSRRELNTFKFMTLFISLGTLIITALTIPFFRYLHPILPYIYVLAVGTLFDFVGKYLKHKWQFSASIVLVVLFAVGQTLGVIFLDSRSINKSHNFDKPPKYYLLGNILKQNTSKDSVVLTNLDTWGSWYGERKSVWFPLEPKMIIDKDGSRIPFDALYLTDYLIDDQNYYMSKDWRKIFENPESPDKWDCEMCDVLAKNFELKSVYTVPASDNYDNSMARAVLLVRK